MDFYNKAENTLNKFTLFGIKKKHNIEKAALDYGRSGYEFFKNGEFDKASKSYIKGAECYNKLNNYDETIKYYNEAARIITDVNKSAEIYYSIIAIYNKLGNFTGVCEYLNKIALLFENYPESIDVYEQLLKYVENNDEYIKTVDKLIILNVKFNNYDKAIKYLLISINGNKSLKLQIPYIFDLILCYIASDNIDFKQKLEYYKINNFYFNNSKECELLIQLIESNNIGGLQLTIDEIYNCNLLPIWKLNLIMDIKIKLRNNL